MTVVKNRKKNLKLKNLCDNMKKVTFSISGMHCVSCAKVIENVLEEKGVAAAVDFKSCKAKIVYDESKIMLEDIIKIIEKEGYKVSR